MGETPTARTARVRWYGAAATYRLSYRSLELFPIVSLGGRCPAIAMVDLAQPRTRRKHIKF